MVATKYGNTLTVVKDYQIFDGKRNRSCVALTCNVCSEDPELYPEPFTTRKNAFEGGAVPCGCNGNYKYTLKQTEILLQRRGDAIGYKFLGWSSINPKSPARSYPLLVCEIHGTESDNTCAGDCLKTSSFGCKACKGMKVSKAQRISDEDMTKRLLKKFNYEKGTIFKRSSSNPRLWRYYCPICSEDIYVKSGTCSGVFELEMAVLYEGAKSCRCGRGYLWTKKQRELDIKNLLAVLNPRHKFKCWETKFEDSHSKFIATCGEGHGDFSKEVSAFLHKKTDCKQCSQISNTNSYGLYKNRLQEEDNLYLVKLSDDKESFLKVGRAFDLDIRFGFYKPLFTVQLLNYFTKPHHIIQNLEKEVLRNFSKASYKPLKPFEGQTECFSLELIPEIEKYIVSRLEEA